MTKFAKIQKECIKKSAYTTKTGCFVDSRIICTLGCNGIANIVGFCERNQQWRYQLLKPIA